MTRPLAAVLLLTLFWATAPRAEWRAPAPLAPPTSDTVRVLTYNIHHGEGTDQQFDLSRLADVIAGAAPDLVALQEVDMGTERSSKVNQLSELARITGLHGTFGRAMAFQGGEYGVAVLSRWPVQNVDNRELPGPPDRERRTALTIEVDPPTTAAPRLRFTATHLDQGRNVENRLTQAQFLNRLLAREDDGPGILAGDMNSRPDTDVMQEFRQWWGDAFAYPTFVDPEYRPGVDYVLVRPKERWRTIESRVIDAPVASDHRPVLVTLRWADQP